MRTVLGVEVEEVGGESPLPVLEQYVRRFDDEPQAKLVRLVLRYDGSEVEAEKHYRPMGFERIARITGYLVGTLDRWNDAKKAEHRDRVKHLSRGMAVAALLAALGGPACGGCDIMAPPPTEEVLALYTASQKVYDDVAEQLPETEPWEELE